jgi:hypothetical protein
MSEYFMVLPEGQPEIETLEEAQRIRDGLNKHVRGTRFRVFRVKRSLHPAHHFPKLVQLLRDIVKAGGLTSDLRDRCTILLTTIGNRKETPHLTVNRTVPEFKRRRAG